MASTALSSSNLTNETDFIKQDDSDYVDKNYYDQSSQIEYLKRQINALVKQNNYLKDLNNKLLRANNEEYD